MRRGYRGAALAFALAFFAGSAFAAITVSSSSSPTLTVAGAVVRVEVAAGNANCLTTPGVNATSSSLAVTSSSGTEDYGACLNLRNTASTARFYKLRYVSGTNEDRFNDVQIKTTGGTHHLKWSSGVLTTSDTGSWLSIASAATAGVHVRVRIGSGPASVISSEILVAKDSLGQVYAVYPLTITFSAT